MKNKLLVHYLGMELPSPIIVAPAGITETAERIARCEENGAGAVVMKTLTEVEIMRSSPTPRFRLLKKEKGLRHFVLYSYEQMSVFNPREYAAEIKKSKKLVDIPVIGSIACSTDNSWKEIAKMIEDAGADALEINLACPHGLDMADKFNIEDRISHITELVSSSVKIPVVSKLPSQLTNPLNVAQNVQNAGARGVVIFNRFIGLDIDVEKQKPIMHGGFAGHGGYWSIYFPLRWISEISPLLKIAISARSGVASGTDAIKYLLAGAATVQVCTAVITRGYQVIKKINTEIIDYLERHDFTSVSQLKGLVCNRISRLEQVDRQKKVRAKIDQEKCKSCDACRQACFYDAIDSTDKKYAINHSKCAGCGLCVEICDFDAISMVALKKNVVKN